MRDKPKAGGLNLVLAVLLTLAYATRGDTDHPPTRGPLKAIEAFYASIERGDAEARIALLAEDVILMPNHWTALRGKEEVAASFRRAAEAVFQLRDRKMERLEVSGDLAYTVNAYDYTYHAKGVHIWRRGNDGQWRLALDIWNSDVPLGEFADE
jgi:ketosteroid isomerase-like protein